MYLAYVPEKRVEITYFGILKTGEKCRRGTETIRKEQKGVGKYLVIEMIMSLPSHKD